MAESNGVLKPATLKLQGDAVLPPLPRETIADVHANTLAWLRIRTATAQELREAVSDLERFTGETGELNHFLKGGDRLMARIESKMAQDLVDPGDAEAVRAALTCRVKRSILNQIQADEDTPWPIIKERLKKAYGGGRWTPEEDIFQLFRESKAARQTSGNYAGNLLAKFNRITEKMRETVSPAEAEARMAFLATILKVQLAKETGRREGLSKDRSFQECAQDMVDVSAREEESRMEVEETGWQKVSFRRPRSYPTTWKRREPTLEGRERQATGERRPKTRSGPRKEERRCHGCGKTGHLVANCPRTKCFECGTEGHVARQCPYMFRRRDGPRGEPMEVNAQEVRRRRNLQRSSESSAESTAASGTSETEGEEPGSSGAGGSRSSPRSRRQRVTTRRWEHKEA